MGLAAAASICHDHFFPKQVNCLYPHTCLSKGGIFPALELWTESSREGVREHPKPPTDNCGSLSVSEGN